jgi:DNA sulfur modification protein DndD
VLIDKLTFKDFLVFPDEQSLEFKFKDDRNVTLILAPNNTGKTSVIRALEFLLYGPPEDKAAEVLPAQATISKLKPGQESSSYVEATIRDGEKRYRIRRTINYERRASDRGSLETKILSVPLEVVRCLDFNDEILPDTAATRSLVGSLVPRKLFDFYFFKGEELTDQLLEGRPDQEMSDHLKTLLYQREWQSLQRTVENVQRKLSRSLSRFTKAEQAYRESLRRRDRLKAQIAEKNTEIELHQKKLKELQRQEQDSDRRIADLASKANPDRKTELEASRRALESCRTTRAKLETDRRDLLGQHSALMLSCFAIPGVNAKLATLRERRVLPPDISEGILNQILESEKCICGRECSPGTAPATAIAKLRKDSIDEGVSDTLYRLSTKTEAAAQTSFLALAKTTQRRLRDIQSNVDRLNTDEAKQEDILAQLEHSGDESAEQDLRQQKRARDQVREEFLSIDRQIREKQSAVRAAEVELSELEAQIRRESAGAHQAGHLGRAIEICEAMDESARKCVQEMVSEIHRQLSRNVSAMYDSIVTDGSKALILRDSLLPTIERGGVQGLKAGGGQKQVLLLSYIIALSQLRSAINQELAKRFGITKFYEQGFFMDSVFGSTQKDYKREISKLLPQHMKQLVILLAGQQWDKDVWKGLEGSKPTVYGIRLQTPSRDKDPAEYEFDVAGKKVKLLKFVKPDEEAFSTIQELKF